jgi:nicotinate phosphoribosyltransferase
MQSIDVYNCSLEWLKIFHQLNNRLDFLWCSTYDDLDIWARKDGDEVEDMEPIIGVIGNPKWFAHLETPTLGVLAQMSAVATSVRRAKSILNEDQSLLFFPARFRHYVSQAPDGAACVVGGGKAMSTDANGEYWGYSGIGTIPHLLIAAYWGDTAKAAIKFDEIIDPKVNRVILVDWENDCIGTSLKVVAMFLQKFLMNRSSYATFKTVDEAKRLLRDYRQSIYHVIGSGKGKVFGVRFDTSGSLIDKSLAPHELPGVNYTLVKQARMTFDELGLQDLKIVVSGGFDEEKLERFKKYEAPYDMVGIGSSIVNKFTVDFTADAVMLEGQPNAKVGRELLDWSKMTEVKRRKVKDYRDHGKVLAEQQNKMLEKENGEKN